MSKNEWYSRKYCKLKNDWWNLTKYDFKRIGSFVSVTEYKILWKRRFFYYQRTHIHSTKWKVSSSETKSKFYVTPALHHAYGMDVLGVLFYCVSTIKYVL